MTAKSSLSHHYVVKRTLAYAFSELGFIYLVTSIFNDGIGKKLAIEGWMSETCSGNHVSANTPTKIQTFSPT